MRGREKSGKAHPHMLDDLVSNLLVLFRWAHILSAIVWLGHLYFFIFVNAPFQKELRGELKATLTPLLLRALWWFRWAAMSTVFFGFLLFMLKYSQPGMFLEEGGGITPRASWILCGIALGLVMWFNVWFVIWPAQRRLLQWIERGESRPEMAALSARSARFSKINAYLSGPLLFFMIAPSNYGAFSAIALVVASSIGAGTIAALYALAK